MQFAGMTNKRSFCVMRCSSPPTMPAVAMAVQPTEQLIGLTHKRKTLQSTFDEQLPRGEFYRRQRGQMLIIDSEGHTVLVLDAAYQHALAIVQSQMFNHRDRPQVLILLEQDAAIVKKHNVLIACEFMLTIEMTCLAFHDDGVTRSRQAS